MTQVAAEDDEVIEPNEVKLIRKVQCTTADTLNVADRQKGHTTINLATF